MSNFRPMLSGREYRRRLQFGEEGRKKGAGWTRKMRRGRTSRLRHQDQRGESE